MTIAVIVGSLRQGSFNQAVADLAINSAPEGIELKQISIAEIPFFNKDLEAQVPEAVTTFAEAVAQADAVLIVTPEYNRSIPGILKKCHRLAIEAKYRGCMDRQANWDNGCVRWPVWDSDCPV